MKTLAGSWGLIYSEALIFEPSALLSISPSTSETYRFEAAPPFLPSNLGHTGLAFTDVAGSGPYTSLPC